MSRRDAIREAFIEGFRKGDFDAGLKRGVEEIEKTLKGHHVGGARRRRPPRSGRADTGLKREEGPASWARSC